MIALENQASEMKHLTAQACIKPIEDAKSYRQTLYMKKFRNQNQRSTNDIAALHYRSQANKNRFVPTRLQRAQAIQYNLESTIAYIVMQIISEIAFSKHIRKISLHQMPMEPIGLLSLIELPYFIEYLYKINSRKKPLQI